MSTTELRPITIYNLESNRPFIRIGAGNVTFNNMCGVSNGTAIHINMARQMIDIYEDTHNPVIRFHDRESIHMLKKDIDDLKFFIYFMDHFEYKP